ncbi:glycosyltransferase family 4 protein [Sphingobacterium phlebotomi]|uniref:Glycosyltransferase family 4 protein n=1 Tax=Sphingobacterium phlebotomi TaxID=2605433 RepID=A0A5D4H7U6_9SPHI|nr:glycosyltransferase family 4 protein [Sphingobacterium phlebotomi]TYR36846.1 glycosyltransferase family 4 protein [Sphingobacterium phlebotomi]
MKIVVIGTRGIPSILGGVETHCEELYPYLAKNFGHEITMICRSCYVIDKKITNYKGIRLKSIYAPRNKAFEAIVHSVLGILYAGFKRPDIVHIHAVGPNLVAPLARLFGLKVVMTHHGPDYERKKWGKLAKFFLKGGEWAGVKFANKVIVISNEIKKQIGKKYGRKDTILIPNGVSIEGRPKYNKEVLDKYNVQQQKYIFSLGRFVPEKGFDYLIRSYEKAGISKHFKLVLAGDADHETDFSQSLKEQARISGVILPGFIKGEDLAQLFSNCALFILPSFYEGLPIALLEGMAYGLPILASDIPANTQVGLPESCYFPAGDEELLSKRLVDVMEARYAAFYQDYNMENYDWKKIAESTNLVYSDLCRINAYKA